MKRRLHPVRARMCLARRRSSHFIVHGVKDFMGVSETRSFQRGSAAYRTTYDETIESEQLGAISDELWLQTGPLLDGRSDWTVYGDFYQRDMNHLYQPWIVSSVDSNRRWLRSHDPVYWSPTLTWRPGVPR